MSTAQLLASTGSALSTVNDRLVLAAQSCARSSQPVPDPACLQENEEVGGVFNTITSWLLEQFYEIGPWVFGPVGIALLVLGFATWGVNKAKASAWFSLAAAALVTAFAASQPEAFNSIVNSLFDLVTPG